MKFKKGEDIQKEKELEALKAENEMLKQQVAEQADALIELAEMLTEGE